MKYVSGLIVVNNVEINLNVLSAKGVVYKAYTPRSSTICVHWSYVTLTITLGLTLTLIVFFVYLVR